MKKRSLAGNVGIGIFLVALICVCVAFGTPAWLVSDYRITNAKLDMLGLWRHCFRSLPNPMEADAPRRFFVGCRWVYDPFTTGYSDIRGYLLPRKFKLFVYINHSLFIYIRARSAVALFSSLRIFVFLLERIIVSTARLRNLSIITSPLYCLHTSFSETFLFD